MKSALLHKRAFTGYPNEVELLEAGGDRLFEVDSLRQPGQRMLVALAEDGTADYPVYDPDKKKVKWKLDDRFGKKFKAEVKKHMEAEVEKAETPKEEQEAVNSPALRQAAGLHEARLTYQCPFCQAPDAKPIGQTQDQTIYRCKECGRKFPMTEQTDVQEHVFASDQWNETPALRPDVVGPAETTSLSQWASKQAASVHDLKPLIDKLRTLHPSGAIRVSEQLMNVAKQIGASDVRDAARHYRNSLLRIKERTSVGIVPRRSVKAVEDAWKRLESAFVHYVR
jgi:ribosomal protein L37AE/L43A